ncbi:Hypothetical protein CINCED_3A018490 [Cinara cedri]|uniref:RRM domain-containing protein n=1 Tax=Cinara cedri TaxID=506608 RepID=A0A5E4MK33_9HEMI|nr:Hypothetical protein CINCED_3A018490 [Cinara cedri]
MDDVYTVGALGDLISSTRKNKKTKSGKIKTENVQSETSLDSFKIENVNIIKDKTPIINPDGLKKIKPTKCITTNEVSEETPLINPNKLKRKKINKLIKPLDDEDKSQMNPKKLKKKKMDKSTMPNDDKEKSPMNPNKLKEKKKDRSIKPNSGKIEKKNPVSKLEDIKSSEEYIEKESRTIFVGNVPVNIKMSAIKKLFKQFGEIETTRLRSVAVKSLDLPRRVSIIKGNFHPQRDTANVYVRFKTKDAAQKALCLNSTKFEEHTIRVDMSLNTDHKQNKKKAIFIGNLPYGIQEDEIWEFFRECGVVSAVRVVRDSTTGVSKGFGFVDFESKECVEFAMQLQVQFRRTKPTQNTQNFQGETMKSKMHKKKGKPTKADLTRKKIAKQLNA